ISNSDAVQRLLQIVAVGNGRPRRLRGKQGRNEKEWIAAKYQTKTFHGNLAKSDAGLSICRKGVSIARMSQVESATHKHHRVYGLVIRRDTTLPAIRRRAACGGSRYFLPPPAPHSATPAALRG